MQQNNGRLLGIFVLSKMLWNYVWLMEDDPRLKGKQHNYLVNKLRDVRDATDKVTRPAERKLKEIGALNDIEESINSYMEVTDLVFQLKEEQLSKVLCYCADLLLQQTQGNIEELVNQIKIKTDEQNTGTEPV